MANESDWWGASQFCRRTRLCGQAAVSMKRTKSAWWRLRCPGYCEMRVCVECVVCRERLNKGTPKQEGLLGAGFVAGMMKYRQSMLADGESQ
jgi:hypothetical protein